MSMRCRICALAVAALLARGSSRALDFGGTQTIAGVACTTRARLDAGSNGDFHIVYLVPTMSNAGTVTQGRIDYVRYRSGTWSRPVTVADLGADSVPTHYADVAGDRNGNAYIVWVSYDRKKFFFARITDASNVVREVRSTRHALRAEVAVDTQDKVRAVYRDKGPEQNWLLSRPIGATSWSSASPIPADAEDAEGQRQPGIAAGKNGKLFYGYRWMAGGPRDRRLAYREFDGDTDTWSGIIDLFGGIEKPWGPQICVDGSGQPHMAWHAGQNPAVLYYRAPDGSVARLGTGAGEDGWPPQIAATDAGEIIIVSSSIENYRAPVASGTVEYRVNGGMGFSRALPVKDGEIPRSYGGVAAHGDTVMMTWVADGQIEYKLGASTPGRGLPRASRNAPAKRPSAASGDTGSLTGSATAKRH